MSSCSGRTAVAALATIAAATFASTASLSAQQAVRVADSLFASQKWPEARAAYVHILATDSLDSWSALRGALALMAQGDNARAAAELSQVAAMSPVRRATALYYRAGALAQSGQRDSAVAALLQSLDAGFLSVRLLATATDLDSLRRMPSFLALERRVFGPHFGEPVSRTGPSAQQMATGIREVMTTIQSRHPNPYRDLSKAELDSHANDLIRRAGHLTESQYLVGLMRLVSQIGDVHSSAWPGPASSLMRRALPIALWKFPEGLFIRAADSTHLDLLGAQLIAIDGAPIAELWPKLIREFPYENEWMAAGEIAFLLRFPDFLRGLGLSVDSVSSSLTLRMPDGSRRVVDLQSSARGYSTESNDVRGFTVPKGWTEAGAASRPLWLRDRTTSYWLASIPERKTVYMQFNLPRDDPKHPSSAFLDSLAATITRERAERLVIDLRHNGGGWGPMGNDLAWKLHELPQVNRPGHLFVITSRVTQSAGVVISAELEHNAHAVFVGEPGAAHPNLFNGRQGNHVPLILPGTGIVYRVSEVQEQNSFSLDVRRFIAPDISAPLT